MKALYLKNLNKSKKKILIFSLIGIVFTWMYVALFPTLQGEGEQFRQILDSYPEVILKAFGINQATLFTTLESTLAMYHYSVIMPSIFLAYAVTTAASTLAGEIEDGSLVTILAQPISRTKLYFSKYLSGLTGFTVFLTISVLSVIPLAAISNIEYDTSAYIYILGLSFLYGLCAYSLAFSLSAFASVKGKVTTIAGGILVSMYSLFLFASLNEAVDSIKYFSFFYYYDYNAALIEKSIDMLPIVMFAGLSFVFTLGGWLLFKRRDFVV